MQPNQHGEHTSGENHYLRLAVMIVLSFISMYVLMYAQGIDQMRAMLADLNRGR